MSLAQAEKSPAAPAPAGGVHFVAATRHTDLCAELRARRYLVAPVRAPERGRLRHAIDDAVEGALAMRGALPPAGELDALLEPTLRDQVFRARALGATGLCVTLPRLGDAAGGRARRGRRRDALHLAHGREARSAAHRPRRERPRRPRARAGADRRSRGAEPAGGAGQRRRLRRARSRPAPRRRRSAPPPVGPPPPVLTIPRRGVMKKRSLRAEAAPLPEETPAAEPTPAPPAVRQEIAPEAPRPDPIALAPHGAAALMAPVPQLDPAPGRPHAPAARGRRRPLRGARARAAPSSGARGRSAARSTPPSGGSTPSISTRPAAPSR